VFLILDSEFYSFVDVKASYIDLHHSSEDSFTTYFSLQIFQFEFLFHYDNVHKILTNSLPQQLVILGLGKILNNLEHNLQTNLPRSPLSRSISGDDLDDDLDGFRVVRVYWNSEIIIIDWRKP
jgi:hypothetical protein